MPREYVAGPFTLRSSGKGQGVAKPRDLTGVQVSGSVSMG